MSTPHIPTLSAQQLRDRLASGSPCRLVDVRGLDEWNHGRIEGATHIPMGEIESRAGELDPAGEVVLYCHHGVRSRKAAEILQKRGFAHVYSLAEGIDGWSLHIDPSIPRY